MGADVRINGYAFGKEHLFTNTSKTVGKIFATSGLKNDKLAENDYVIIKLRTKTNEYKMFKFVYVNSVHNEWKIDDYTEVR